MFVVFSSTQYMHYAYCIYMMGTFTLQCVWWDRKKTTSWSSPCSGDALLSALTHMFTKQTQQHTHTHTPECTQTQIHTDHLTGKALACYVCWHGFKVYVTVCIPVPVFVSLVFPRQSHPWQSPPGKALGTASEYCGHPGSLLRPSPRYVARTIICTLYG